MSKEREQQAPQRRQRTKSAGRTKPAPAAARVDSSDAIIAALEDDIAAGRLRPGGRLDERELAKRFNVSRTPIREVLARLSSLGIIELRRNQGAFVADLSLSRVVGMLEVSGELKVLAARQAARRMSPEERERLKMIGGEMKAAADAGDLQRYFDHANAMIDLICEGTHNTFLRDTMRNIQVRLCAYRRQLARTLHKPIQTSLEENSNMIDAVARGEPEEAERWMRRHAELRREEFSDLVTLISEQGATTRTPIETAA